MTKTILYELDECCSICNTNLWVGTNFNTRYFILTHTSNISYLTINKKLIGIQTKDNQRICLKCFELLIGLENYYDSFFVEILENHFLEAKAIINNILSNKDILKEVTKIRSKGKFIPQEYIENAIINSQ